MSLSDIQCEFMWDVAKLLTYAQENGYKITGGELKRTRAQQEIYVSQGKSKTMDSDHLNGLAIDLNIFYDYDGDGDKDYIGTMSKQDAMSVSEDLCEYWKSLNPKNYSGRDWGWDIPHFGRKT